MRVRVKIRDSTWQRMQSDLSRPHDHAAERVGFLFCGFAQAAKQEILILDSVWQLVQDDHYLRDEHVGACIGPQAFRSALQFAYNHAVSVLHVHRHDHHGQPWFSKVDVDSMQQFVPDFWNVQPALPHGALVLSYNRAAGAVWLPTDRLCHRIARIDKVGTPLERWNGDE